MLIRTLGQYDESQGHQPLEAVRDLTRALSIIIEIPTEEVRVPTEKRNLRIITTWSFLTDGIAQSLLCVPTFNEWVAGG